MKLKLMMAAAAFAVLPLAAPQAGPMSQPQVAKTSAAKQSLALSPQLYRYCIRKYYSACIARFGNPHPKARYYCHRWARSQCSSGVNG